MKHLTQRLQRTLVTVGGLGLVLAACTGPQQPPPTPPPAPPAENPPSGSTGGTRLLEVTIDLRNTNAEARLLEPASRSLAPQAVTTYPSGNTSLELDKTAVGWNDDDTDNVRYFYATFRVDNNTGDELKNLTAWGLDVPVASGAISRPTVFGTAFSTVKDGAGLEITDGAVIRGIQPIHSMRPVLNKVKIDKKLADLQILSDTERGNVDAQLNATYGLTGGATLGYGFVGRDFGGNGRVIDPTNGTPGAANSCTVNACKGFITFAFQVPVEPLSSVPRENRPAVFTFVSAVGNQGVTYTTQSLEEQATGTIAGIAKSAPAFADIGTPRLLSGSSTTFFDTEKEPQNLCQVETANPSGTFTAPVLMPPTVSTTPGTLDTCQGSGGILSGSAGDPGFNNANAAILDGQGRLLVAGIRADNGNDMVVYRFKNEELDTSFNAPNGYRTIGFGGSETATGVALNSRGEIIVVGSKDNQDIVVARLLDDGTLDSSFDADGKMTINSATEVASGVSVEGDNIYVGGTSGVSPNRDFLVAKVTNVGTLDTTFGTGGIKTFDIDGLGDDVATGIDTTSSNIFMVGSRSSGGSSDWAVAKLEIVNGGINVRSFFDVNNQETSGAFVGADAASAVRVDASGKVVIAGSNTSSGGGSSNFAVARMTSALGFDSSFGVDSSGTADADGVTIRGLGLVDIATSLALNADGTIVLGGYTNVNGSNDFVAKKFTATGGSSTTSGPTDFEGSDTQSDTARATVVDDAGRVVLIGGFATAGIQRAFGLAWYHP